VAEGRRLEAYNHVRNIGELQCRENLAEFKTTSGGNGCHRLLGTAIGWSNLLPFLFILWRGMIGGLELKRAAVVIFEGSASAGQGARSAGDWWGLGAFAAGPRFRNIDWQPASVLALRIFAASLWATACGGEERAQLAGRRYG